MRRRAQQAGNLKSTAQESVTTQGTTIVIEPADPQVVYVPEYDPWIVYGDPLAFYPGWIGVPGFYFDGPGSGSAWESASVSSVASAGDGTAGERIGTDTA